MSLSPTTMDPTSLPTDNLYKFVALGCLVAIGAVWYSTNKKGNELGDQKKGVRLEQDKLAVILANIELDSQVSGGKPDGQLLARKRDAEMKALELNTYVRVLNELTDYRVKSSSWALLWIVFLVVGATTGFVFWYRKVQWFQDRVTYDSWREQRAKADMAELELARTKSGQRIINGRSP